jgi:ribulose-phosphate 3-epimerase
MPKIVPAIQPASLEDFQQKLRTVRQLTNRFQLDIVAADFNDTPTIELPEITLSPGIECDIHIMARNPLPHIEAAKRLYPHLIIVQYEGVENIKEILERLHEGGQAIGVAINPETEVSDIANIVPMLDHVLIMAYPSGPSGQTLQPKVLKKVAQVRALKPSIEVGLDGGVAEDTLSLIAKAGFDVVNTTSFLFSADDPLSRYTQLMEALAS